MSRAKNPSMTPLEKAIAAGRISAVKEWLETRQHRSSWIRSDEPADPTTVKDGDGEPYNPLQRALNLGKTNVAFVFLQYGWQLTPQQEQQAGLFDEFRPDGALSPTTNEQATFQAVMRHVRTYRMFSPLPKAQRELLESLRDHLVDQEGPDQVLLRVLHTPSDWLHWTPALLKAGASPNAYTVNPDNGTAVHVLTLAAINGMEHDTRALLEAGANPFWKSHDWKLPAHVVADLPAQANFVLTTGGALSLAVFERREQCLHQLLAIPGVAEAQDFHGRTPLQLWRASLEKVLDGWKNPADAELKAKFQSRFRAPLLDLDLPQATPAKSVRPRF